MKRMKDQVFASITHGHRLLVFRHPAVPEAGIQVPAGTLKADEHPEAAVLREAFEETGLALSGFLGEQIRDRADLGREEIHHRRFYHLCGTGSAPETWRHEEPDPSDGEPDPILFEFFWGPLPHGVPSLMADQGKMLPSLGEKLFSERMSDPLAPQGKSRPAKHHPLDEFDPGHLTFDLPV